MDNSFKNWKLEKAVQALIDEAQALADKLDAMKPHVTDGLAAAAQFWAVSYLAEGQDLHQIGTWKPAELRRFITGASSKITALRKQRLYDSSDGLAVWLHSARAVTEPRVAPATKAIWLKLSQAGPNADSWLMDLLQDAGLNSDQPRQVPLGFEASQIS
jgi:hypothetical protein